MLSPSSQIPAITEGRARQGFGFFYRKAAVLGIILISNSVNSSTVVLRIKGRVLEPAAEVIPEKKNDPSSGSPVNNK